MPYCKQHDFYYQRFNDYRCNYCGKLAEHHQKCNHYGHTVEVKENKNYVWCIMCQEYIIKK